MTWWSFFTSATALCWNAASMVVVRFLFGVGEAGAFPIATRSLSRWMLPSERGYAQGVTHAGSRLGAAFTPPIVVWLMTQYGWRAPFFVFGCVGILWAAVWYWYYRDTPSEHRSVNAGGTAVDSLAHRRAIANLDSGSLESHLFFADAVADERDVFLLRLLPGDLPRLVSDVPDQAPRIQPEADGILCESAAVGRDCRRSWLAGGSPTSWFKRTGNVVMARRVIGMVGFLTGGVRHHSRYA